MSEQKNTSRIDSDDIDIDKLEADFRTDSGNFVPLARLYINRKLPQQAIKVCQKGLKNKPNSAEGLLALGMAYYHNYDDRNAEKTLREVVRTTPGSAVAHRTLGEILLERHQDQKATTTLQRALELEPRDLHTRSLLLSLNEKLPGQPGTNGQPMEQWLPRKAVIPRETQQPMWQILAEVLAVALLVAGGLFWYNHRVEVRQNVSKHIKAANALIPRDNYKDLLSAEKEINAALALDSSDEKSIMRQAYVHGMLMEDHLLDRKQQLQSSLKWMDNQDLPNPERFALKGLLLINEGKPEEANKFLSNVIKQAIDKKDIYLNAMVFGVRGSARLKMGRTKGAREDFGRAAKFSSDTPHFHAKFAEVYVREGNYQRSVKFFQEALRQNPAHIYSNLRLSHSLIQLGKGLEQAKKILDQYSDTSQYPLEDFSPVQLGMLYLDRAELSLAVRNLSNPGPAGSTPGAPAEMKDSLSEANSWLNKSLAAYEASAEAHNLAGIIATFNQDQNKAAAEFARALQLDPVLPRIYFDRSESLYLFGQPALAIEKLREFESHLKPTVDYHIHVGNLYSRTNEMDKALAEYQKAIKVDELNPTARFALAQCYQRMGERLGTAKEKHAEKLNLYNQARQSYEDSLMLPGGEHPEVYRMMGLIYLDSDDFDNAMDKFAKAAMMMQQSGDPGPRIATVYLDIAKVFKAMGGAEGEKQERIYRAKAQALKEGKPLEQVEKEWANKNPKLDKQRNK